MRTRPATAAALLFAFLVACGGSQAETSADPTDGGSDASGSNGEAVTDTRADRCQELQELLVVAARSGNEDVVLTAYYALRDGYSTCRDVLPAQREGTMDQEMTRLLVDVTLLQATDLAVRIIYGNGEDARACAITEEAYDMTQRVLDDIEIAQEIYGESSELAFANVQSIAVSEARFFGFTAATVCAELEEAQTPPEGEAEGSGDVPMP